MVLEHAVEKIESLLPKKKRKKKSNRNRNKIITKADLDHVSYDSSMQPMGNSIPSEELISNSTNCLLVLMDSISLYHWLEVAALVKEAPLLLN